MTTEKMVKILASKINSSMACTKTFNGYLATSNFSEKDIDNVNCILDIEVSKRALLFDLVREFDLSEEFSEYEF